MLVAYLATLILLTLYSFALIDLNLTLFNHPLWEIFRGSMIQLGYFQRSMSSNLYVVFIIALFLFHIYFIRKYKQFNALKVAGLTALVLFFSYPFLSHDFFNYMFDAKILTVYGQNPYVHKALDFPADPWLLFMHWTHRTYPYGPTFLPLTLIPSFLAFGKLVLNMYLFKVMFLAFYMAAVHFLNRKNTLWGMFFATQPLILVEGLMNAHNDLIALSLGTIGYVLLVDKKTVWARAILLISGGIKYLTLPLVFLSKENQKLNRAVLTLIIAFLGYLTIKSEVQSWYFLALISFLPIFPKFITRLNIFYAGLLLCYYPFVREGIWNDQTLFSKHMIIVIALMLNVVYLVFIEKKAFLRR